MARAVRPCSATSLSHFSPPSPHAVSREPTSADVPPKNPALARKRARRRLLLRLLLTGVAMLGSTTAFALEYTAAGAALGVVAGLVSAYAMWGWIQSNGEP